MDDEKKKGFISEKIVGRNLTKSRALKYVALAILCGIVLGLSAFLVFSFAQKRAAAAEAARSQSSISTEETLPETYTAPPETETFSDTEITDNTEISEPADESESTPVEQPSDVNGSPDSSNTEAPESEPVKSDDTDDEDPADEESPDDNAASVTAPFNIGVPESVLDSVVVIESTRIDATWFESMVETSETYAGLVVSADENEILILTPAAAVENGEVLSVVFSDGTRNNAVIKQFSGRDGLSVLAVPVDGLGKDFLDGIVPAELKFDDEPFENGLFYTVGAPLGHVPSCGIGVVGYVSTGEQTVDGVVNACYSDVAVDYSKGTFMADTGGTIVGIALNNSDDTGRIARFVSIGSIGSLIRTLIAGEEPAYIGITGTDVSFEMRYNNIPTGMYVTDVEPDSPADRAGIRRGDIITRIGDAEVGSAGDYAKHLAIMRASDSVLIKYKRGSSSDEYRDFSAVVTALER